MRRTEGSMRTKEIPRIGGELRREVVSEAALSSKKMQTKAAKTGGGLTSEPGETRVGPVISGS